MPTITAAFIINSIPLSPSIPLKGSKNIIRNKNSSGTGGSLLFLFLSDPAERVPN